MARRRTTPTPATSPGQFTRYGARVFDDTRHDPYEPRGKYAEGTHCGTCGATYRDGRWRWGSGAGAGAGAGATEICPACRRTRDRLPAGHVIVEGPYVAAHRAELVHLVRHQSEQENAEHPMHRIMALDESPERIEVTTTDIHLPRRIGEALRRAHDGNLEITFDTDAYGVRVHWRR